MSVSINFIMRARQMAFKSVGGGKGEKKYLKYNECEDGQLLVVGTFLGTSEGRYGPQHEFRLEDGSVQVLNSAGHLNYQIDNFVSPQDVVRVVYLGKETIGSGTMKGKSAHKFDVQVDDGSPEVAAPKTERAAKTTAKGEAAKAVALAKPVKKKVVVKAEEDFEL
jgi:hypothetical protein